MARRDDDELSPDRIAPGADEGAARAIAGILGDSPRGDHVRLYLDLDFVTSYEIPREAIVRRVQVPADQSPFGVESSIVWVRPGTELTVLRVETRRLEEEFLAGDFTAPGSFASVTPPPAAAARVIRTATISCRSLDGPDFEGLAICRTANPAFPSCGWKCPTDVGGGCGSNIGCPQPTWGSRCWTVTRSCWEVC